MNNPGNIKKQLNEICNHNSKMQNYNGYLLIKNGEDILYDKGFGYSNYAGNQLQNRETIYLLGSLTKSFTAICVMMLVHEKIIKLTDKLISFFPDYTESANISVSNLLCHSSGISDYWNRVGISSIDYTDEYAIFDFIKSFELINEPDKNFQYCNSNYLILGILIEKVTGIKYEDFLSNKIFSPLAMKRSGIIPKHHLFDDVAVGYMRLKPDVKEAAKPENTVIFGNMLGAGCIFSTVNDLIKFDNALNHNILLPDEIKKDMWKPKCDNYGYGWFVSENIVLHGGDIVGFSVRFTKYLKENITVIAINNVDGKRESHMGHYSELIEGCIL